MDKRYNIRMNVSGNGVDLIVYTDGSCLGNPGPGAAATVITDLDGNIIKSYTCTSELTTNNRMELTAVIMALKSVARGNVLMTMDSSYVHDGITKWMQSWKARGWKKADKNDVLNVDLWKDIDELIDSHQGVLCFKLVRGHAGDIGNELADQLAQNAARKLEADQKSEA